MNCKKNGIYINVGNFQTGLLMGTEGDWKQNVIVLSLQKVSMSLTMVFSLKVVHTGDSSLDISKEGDSGTSKHGAGLYSISWVAPLDTKH
jgi:hypothetical protein